MASIVGICSNALRKLGDDSITSLSDNSDRARLCNNLYAEVRDELLQLRNWNFAIARTSLARLADTPAFEWSFQYQLPSDCIRVIHLQYLSEPYKVEADKLLSDAESVNVTYLKQETDPNLYAPLFVSALEARLVAELAYPITGDLNLQTTWYQIADKRLKEASYMDAVAEGTPDQLYCEVFTDGRFSNTGYTVSRRGI